MRYYGMSGIYAIENITNGKAYIGSAVDLGRRWLLHQRTLLAGTHNKKLQAAWNKYGQCAFRFVVLEEVSKELLLEREQAWIDSMESVDCGYNIRRVAHSNLGIKFGPETKAKQSAASKGRKHRPESIAKMTGRKHSDESKKRMSVAQKGRKVSDECREKLRIANLGRPAPPKTPEGLAALSAHRRGKPQPEANRRALQESRRAKSKISQDQIDVIKARYVPHCPVNGSSAIAREFGVSQSLISMIISGKRRGEV